MNLSKLFYPKIFCARILGLSLLILPFTSGAQNKEINPNVQWNYVYQQHMSANDAQLYTFEFPMEKGYDYAIHIDHKLPSAAISIKVFDLQMKPIASYKTGDSQQNYMVEFDVPHHSTYLIYFVVDAQGSDLLELPIEMNIVRRLKT